MMLWLQPETYFQTANARRNVTTKGKPEVTFRIERIAKNGSGCSQNPILAATPTSRRATCDAPPKLAKIFIFSYMYL